MTLFVVFIQGLSKKRINIRERKVWMRMHVCAYTRMHNELTNDQVSLVSCM